MNKVLVMLFTTGSLELSDIRSESSVPLRCLALEFIRIPVVMEFELL
jgi:hypothetical protein